VLLQPLCCSLVMSLVLLVEIVGCSMYNWWIFVRHEEDCEPESELDSDEISEDENDYERTTEDRGMLGDRTMPGQCQDTS
jgi:hypothetical protein